MKVDLYAGLVHYLHHCLPVWLALPEELRGVIYLTHKAANAFEIDPIYDPSLLISRRHPAPAASDPIIVASLSDMKMVPSRPVIFVEHGAGMRYAGVDDGAYSGGPGRDRVILFICPSEAVAAANLTRYPDTPAVIAGCPKLDPFHLQDPKPRSDPPTIGFTFHADLRLVPETRTGFYEFFPAIELVRAQGYNVIASAHPRIYLRIQRHYRNLNIPHTPHLSEVFDTADVLVCDNTSAGPEFASLGRPLVWCSPSYYRRDVHHGGRFWEWLVLGEHAEDALEVPGAVDRALAPVSSALVSARLQCLQTIYAHMDGKASIRAAEAIMEVIR